MGRNRQKLSLHIHTRRWVDLIAALVTASLEEPEVRIEQCFRQLHGENTTTDFENGADKVEKNDRVCQV